MSLSSLSFQPGNPGYQRPFNYPRSNGPFVPKSSHAFAQSGFQATQPSPRFTNNPNGPSPGQAVNTNPNLPHQLRQTDIGTPRKPNSKPADGQKVTSEGTPQTPDKAPGQTKEKKSAVGPIGFIFPVMTLIGTPLMLATSLLGIQKNKANELEYNPNMLSKIFLGLGKNEKGKLEYKATVLSRLITKAEDTNAAKQAIQKSLLGSYKVGRFVLAMGIIPKSLIGVMYGIQAQQPSILFAHLLQLPLAHMIIKENKTATTLVYLMGGLFTLGFINDIQNGHIKEGLKGSENEQIRQYDMTRLKQAFGLHSGLSLGKRITQSISEIGKMVKFSAEDHVVSSKRAFHEVNKLMHGDKNELTDVKTTGSISKSSLGFMLSYAATIPALLGAALIKNAESKQAHWLSRYSMATTLLSGLMLNFGMMLVALNGKNWAERVPMFGTSMELSGTVMGYSPNSIIQPIALALQQLGGGLNSIFFASKAQKD